MTSENSGQAWLIALQSDSRKAYAICIPCGGFPTFLDNWWILFFFPFSSPFFFMQERKKTCTLFDRLGQPPLLEWGLHYESVFFCFFLAFTCWFTRHPGRLWNLSMTSMGQRNWSSRDSCNAPSLLRFYSFLPGWHPRQILSIKPFWLSTNQRHFFTQSTKSCN